MEKRFKRIPEDKPAPTESDSTTLHGIPDGYKALPAGKHAVRHIRQLRKGTVILVPEK